MPGVNKRAIPEIKEGDTVLHDRWGEGVVVQVSGSADDPEATIRFGEAGRSGCSWPTRPSRRSAERQSSASGWRISRSPRTGSHAIANRSSPNRM